MGKDQVFLGWVGVPTWVSETVDLKYIFYLFYFFMPLFSIYFTFYFILLHDNVYM